MRTRTGHEKYLIYCPGITTETLLHFNRQGDSYRLRSFVGDLAGRSPWTQPEAATAQDFLRICRPEVQVDVTAVRINLHHADRWKEIVVEHNRRLGIPREG